jgi:hypothetical protein
MGMRQESRPEMLGDVAGGYAATIVRAVQQEYPNDLHHRRAVPGVAGTGHLPQP